MIRTKRARGFTTLELMTGITLMSLVILTSVAMARMGMRSYYRTEVDADLQRTNATALRRISEALRGAMSATISPDGRTLYYYLPARRTIVEPLTGEMEIKDPLVSDGVQRTYKVTYPNPSLKRGTLIEGTSKVIASGLYGKDPEKGSTQEKAEYRTFQLTTIGSLRAVTITLVTQKNDLPSGETRYVRMKTTVVLRNSGS